MEGGAWGRPQIHFKRAQKSVSFMSRVGRMGKARGDWGLQTSRHQQGPNKSIKSLSFFLICWLLLIWVWSWGSCKSLINNHYFVSISHLLGRGTFWQAAVLAKTQASSIISLIICITITGATCLKVMGKMLTRIKIESKRGNISLSCKRFKRYVINLEQRLKIK